MPYAWILPLPLLAVFRLRHQSSVPFPCPNSLRIGIFVCQIDRHDSLLKKIAPALSLPIAILPPLRTVASPPSYVPTPELVQSYSLGHPSKAPKPFT
jgi:hypothetical protein